MISVREITMPADLEKAFEIRRKVFVIEQNVPAAEEYDEFEKECIHFLALHENFPVGTARIRKTEKGFKLERFAVLKNFRNFGVGKHLVAACLNHPWLKNNSAKIYMHAQEHAIPFYLKCGFETIGERFWECEIPHFVMVYKI